MRAESWLTMEKFINGLRSGIRREINLNSPETLDEAYHKALEIGILVRDI